MKRVGTEVLIKNVYTWSVCCWIFLISFSEFKITFLLTIYFRYRTNWDVVCLSEFYPAGLYVYMCKDGFVHPQIAYENTLSCDHVVGISAFSTPMWKDIWKVQCLHFVTTGRALDSLNRCQKSLPIFVYCSINIKSCVFWEFYCISHGSLWSNFSDIYKLC